MMTGERTYKTTSAGLLGQELTDFPSYHLRPQLSDKRRIQSGYLDLLFYEYRCESATTSWVMGIYCFLVAFVVWVSPPYTSYVPIAFVIMGFLIVIFSNRTVKRFKNYKNEVISELRRLGAGITHEQLNHRIIDSSAWGEVSQYSVSDFGMVRPVTTDGMPDEAFVFDLFRDEVYR